MTTSVVLCTYNGEQFIEQQLQSILDQTVIPDEIIIQDDGSTDRTIEIIEGLRLNSNVPIFIEQNETNLGVLKNFQKAAKRASNEIVFFADQDDVWNLNKVELVLNTFKQYSEKNLVIHNLDFIRNGQVISNHNFWNYKQFNPILTNDEILEFLVLNKNIFPGMSMTFRRKELLENFPLSTEIRNMLHDYQLAVKFASRNEIQLLNDSLAFYRLHPNQAVGKNIKLKSPIKEKITKQQIRRIIKRKPMINAMVKYLNLPPQFKSKYQSYRNKMIVKFMTQWFSKNGQLINNDL